MTTTRVWGTLLLAGTLTGFLAACDHLIPNKPGEKEAEAATAEKKEPVSVMPSGDRYGGATNPAQ